MGLLSCYNYSSEVAHYEHELVDYFVLSQATRIARIYIYSAHTARYELEYFNSTS